MEQPLQSRRCLHRQQLLLLGRQLRAALGRSVQVLQLQLMPGLLLQQQQSQQPQQQQLQCHGRPLLSAVQLQHRALVVSLPSSSSSSSSPAVLLVLLPLLSPQQQQLAQLRKRLMLVPLLPMVLVCLVSQLRMQTVRQQ
jgi:hypothetical protein